MRNWMVVVALVLLLAGTVDAHGRRGGRGSRGASCGMSSGGGYADYSAPAVSYQAVTEYVTVTRQICSYEPETKEEEYTEVTFKPKETKEDREETYYEPKTIKKTIKQKVWKMVSEKKMVKYQVAVPAKKKVEQSWTTYEPKITTEKRPVTRMVPQTRTVTQVVPHTTWERVAVQGCQTCQVQVPCPPGQCGPCYATVTVPTVSYRCVPKTVNITHKYDVCEYVAKTESVDVQVCNYEAKVHKQMVDVDVWETKDKEEEVTVCSWKEVEEDVDVTYCEMEKKTRKVPVTVVTYERVETKKTRPVTTYKMVTRTVTEKVPVTSYVPVYTAPCGPSYTPPPCGY